MIRLSYACVLNRRLSGGAKLAVIDVLGFSKLSSAGVWCCHCDERKSVAPQNRVISHSMEQPLPKPIVHIPRTF